jgi:hypothetical protein
LHATSFTNKREKKMFAFHFGKQVQQQLGKRKRGGWRSALQRNSNVFSRNNKKMVFLASRGSDHDVLASGLDGIAAKDDLPLLAQAHAVR